MIQAAPRHALQVDIRHFAPTDLARVQRALPPEHPEAHVRRLADQRAGRTEYLIAWVATRPVGHVVLRWGGPQNSELLWLLSPRNRPPYVEALFVHEAYRSSGIGSALLAEAERLVLLRGHRKIGLAVAVENWRARDLYQRLGFRHEGIGSFTSAWSYVNERGDEIAQHETCIYLSRALGVRTWQPDEFALGRSL